MKPILCYDEIFFAVLWNREDLLRFRSPLWKVLVPVPYTANIKQISKNEKIAQYLAFSM
jgi:hypothetical protein